MTHQELPPDETNPQTETAIEQGIYNDFMAEAAAAGVWPGREPAIPVKLPVDDWKHSSHRGGRSFPEEYKDPQTYSHSVPLNSAEVTQQAIVFNGTDHASALSVAAAAFQNGVKRESKGNVSLERALNKAHNDLRERSLHPKPNKV